MRNNFQMSKKWMFQTKENLICFCIFHIITSLRGRLKSISLHLLYLFVFQYCICSCYLQVNCVNFIDTVIMISFFFCYQSALNFMLNQMKDSCFFLNLSVRLICTAGFNSRFLRKICFTVTRIDLMQ